MASCVLEDLVFCTIFVLQIVMYSITVEQCISQSQLRFAVSVLDMIKDLLQNFSHFVCFREIFYVQTVKSECDSKDSPRMAEYQYAQHSG